MKRFLFALTLLLSIMVLPLFTIAQAVVDTSAISPAPSQGASILDWIYWSAIIIATVIYPILVRLIPTSKNWDWISGIMRLLSWLVPNNKKGGGKH